MQAYLYSQRPELLLERLIGLCIVFAAISDVCGAEGQAYSLASLFVGLIVLELRLPRATDLILYKFMALSIVLDIAFLASWPDRGSAVATFSSFALLTKIAIVWFTRQFIAVLAGGDGPTHLGAKLATDDNGEAGTSGGMSASGSSSIGSPSSSSSSSSASSIASSSGGYQGSYQQSM